MLPCASFLAVSMSSAEAKFPPFFVENIRWLFCTKSYSNRTEWSEVTVIYILVKSFSKTNIFFFIHNTFRSVLRFSAFLKKKTLSGLKNAHNLTR